MSDAKRKWLSDQEWSNTQFRVPITCVDVLPIRTVASGGTEAGLIYRETPHQGRRWCLIGGRLLRNEPLRDAVVRQVQEVLGAKAHCVLDTRAQPLFVAEYFSRQMKGSLFDPRQHAIGLTFVVQVQGAITPRGEALDFRWFNFEALPNTHLFGFGQKKVVLECVRRLSGGNGASRNGRLTRR